MPFIVESSGLRLGTPDGRGEFEETHLLVEQGPVVDALGIAERALRVEEIDEVCHTEAI
jgi:hypothetical protein